MASVKRALINLIAAIAAQDPPRKPGIDAYVPAIVLLGFVIAMPLYAALLWLVRVLTRAHPLSADPVLELALEAILGGLIIAAEIIRIWRVPIEAQLAVYDSLDAVARQQLRVRTLASGLAASGITMVVFLVVVQP